MCRDKLLVVVAAASIIVGAIAVYVGNKACNRAEAYMQAALDYKDEADAYKGEADAFKARLSVAKGQLADAERRIAEARKGLTKRERQILAEHEVGKPGTVSRKANSWMNVKTPNGKPNYWKGQRGIDKQGHCIWEAPEYSLRAGALTLRSYYKRHGIKTVRGIVERYSTSNHEEYADYVATRLGVSPDDEIDVIRRIPELLRYMAEFETGRPVPARMLATLDILGKI